MQAKRALFYKGRNFIGEPLVVEQQLHYPAGCLERQRYKSVIVEDGVYLCAFEVKDPVHVKKYKDTGLNTILRPGRYSDLLSLGQFTHFRVINENCTHSIDILLNIDNNNNNNDSNNSSNYILTLKQQTNDDCFIFQTTYGNSLKQLDIPKQCNSTNPNEASMQFTISNGNRDIEKGSLLIKYNEKNGFYSVSASSCLKTLEIQQIGRTHFIFQLNPQTSTIVN